MERNEVHQVTIESDDCAPHCIAESRRVSGDRVKDGLDVSRWLADDAQYFTGRRLLLESLAQGTRQVSDFFAQVRIRRRNLSTRM